MNIGILMCGHTRPGIAETHGDFDTMFANLLAGHGFTFQAFDVENMDFPKSVQACDGWLLTGSKHGAYEDHPFIPPLERFIRDAFAAKVPMVGICFGHQIIAQALGGRVEKWSGGWGLGRTAYEFDGLGQVQLTAWHQDQVTERPEGASVIASNPFCENAALAYGDRILTVQAHPEFSGTITSDYVDLLKGTGTFPDDRMDHARDASSLPLDQQAMANQIAALFHKAREAAHV